MDIVQEAQIAGREGFSFHFTSRERDKKKRKIGKYKKRREDREIQYEYYNVHIYIAAKNTINNILLVASYE